MRKTCSVLEQSWRKSDVQKNSPFRKNFDEEINWHRTWPPKLEKAGNFLSTLARSNSCFRFFRHNIVACLLIKIIKLLLIIVQMHSKNIIQIYTKYTKVHLHRYNLLKLWQSTLFNFTYIICVFKCNKHRKYFSNPT